jgi:hypothetical protein
VTPGAFSFFSAAPPSVLSPVTPIQPGLSLIAFRLNNRRRCPQGVLDSGTDRFDSRQGRGYIAGRYAYSSAFHRALPADTCRRPPCGSGWLHEIKHDGYRLMARRDPVGIRLITRRGNDWSDRFPLVVEAVNHLKVRSCLIDGEVVCCDERGLARFDVLRRRRNEVDAFLYAFDLLELDGTDLRRDPIEVRKATSICARAAKG